MVETSKPCFFCLYNDIIIVGDSCSYGVRPVIELLKSLFSSTRIAHEEMFPVIPEPETSGK